ncbi:hypothetical protein [Humisphaera borealis]|uniref:Uncharacterized protein n=1 Tax=Humisphaera borealis TaxID=2807512 RepID=A0A7M2WUK2_9BACT|nr:hypothetical protein [Humisphaera borealis]QOV88481.1 hypothetical protein IPV69_19850 [Humisphaera borealis]
MISTRSLHILPDIEPLRRVCQAVATLDAVLSPEWEFRYYTYQRSWDANQQLASMRDEMGDEWFLLFSPAGAILKGYVPDSAMAETVHERGAAWPGVLDAVPPALGEILHDPRLGGPRATFCVWRQRQDKSWYRGRVQFPSGPDPDGSEHLMTVLDGDPVSYTRWAEQYYEIEIPFIEVRRIYMHRPMTEEMARALNPNTDWGSLIDELQKIGYPTAPEPKT